MKTEIEAKFLEVKIDELRSKIEKLGGKLVHKERLMRRNVFDFPDRHLEKISGWVRVRDEGDKVTVSYKEVRDWTINGTKDITVEVKDFDAMTDFLLAIGLDKKSYQETRRESWDLNGVEIDIDTWPWLPTYVELESDSEEKVRETAERLGFDWSKAMHGSADKVYATYYNISMKEVCTWETITFTPVPDWLAIHKK